MVLGTYKQITLGRSTDKQIQKISQDGGIVTALLSFALDEKIIDGAVVAGPSDEMWKPEPIVALTSAGRRLSGKVMPENLLRISSYLPMILK